MRLTIAVLVMAGMTLGCNNDVAKPDLRADGPRIDGPKADLPKVDGSKADLPKVDGPKADLQKVDGPKADLPKVDGSKADLQKADLPKTDGPAANSIGPAGGTATSADGKAELIVPAGALASTVLFTLVPAAGTPSGNLDKAYDLGPNGTTFAAQATVRITYDPAQLGGADESKLLLATVVGGVWQAVSGSSADVTNHRVSGKVDHLSPYGVMAGGTPGVVKVLVIPLYGHVGVNGGQLPLKGVALDASNVPVLGATITYSVDKPTLASVDATGMVTGGTLSGTVPEVVTITADAGGGVTATQSITVDPKPNPTIVMSSPVGTPYSVMAMPASTPLAGVDVIHVQNTSSKVTTDGSGQFLAFPAVPALSFFTFRFTKTSYIDTYYTGFASNVNMVFSNYWMLFSPSVIPATICGKSIDTATKASLQVTESTTKAGWTYYVSTPGAVVGYQNPVGTFDCTLTATAATGQTNIFNLAPGLGWVVAKNGTTVKGGLYHVPAGNGFQTVAFP